MIFSFDNNFCANPVKIGYNRLFYFFMFQKKILDNDFRFKGTLGHGL